MSQGKLVLVHGIGTKRATHVEVVPREVIPNLRAFQGWVGYHSLEQHSLGALGPP